MLDWETLRRCHEKVPVRCWPVLWFYLACLRLTLNKAWAEGRDGVIWSLKPNGVIYIKHWGESTAERARRGGLPAGFDRTPWTRLETSFEPSALAHLEGAIAHNLALSALFGPGTGLVRAGTAARSATAALSNFSSLTRPAGLPQPGSPLLHPP